MREMAGPGVRLPRTAPGASRDSTVSPKQRENNGWPRFTPWVVPGSRLLAKPIRTSNALDSD
jgi:hypothetical protein